MGNQWAPARSIGSCILAARRTAFFSVTLGIVPGRSSLSSFVSLFLSLPASLRGPLRLARSLVLTLALALVLANRRTAYNKPDRAEFLPRRLPFFFPVCPFCLAGTAEKRQPLIYGRNDDRLLSSFAYDCGLGRPWKDQALEKTSTDISLSPIAISLPDPGAAK